MELDWLEQLKQQYPAMAGLLGSIEPSEKDKKSAMTNALLTAGAGILAANNGRGPPMSAIGQGLLGGVQSYSGAIDSQRKDAMGRLQGISGLLGLGQSLQKNQMFQDFMGGGEQQPAPSQEMGPPADLAPNFMGPPASMAGKAPSGQSTIATLGQVLIGRGIDPSVVRAAQVESAMKQTLQPLLDLHKETKLATGAGPAVNPFTGQVQGGVMGNSTLSAGPGGTQATPIGGLSEQTAQAEALKKQRELEATNQLTPGSVNVGNVPVNMPVSSVLEAGRRNAANYGLGGPSQWPEQPTPQMLALLEQASKGGPVRYDANTGPMVGDAAKKNPATPGIGIAPEEQAALTLKATNPLEREKTLQAQIVQNTMDRFKEVSKGADEATQAAPKIARMTKLLSDPTGVYGGAAAPGVLGLAKWANALGIPFDTKRFANSQEADAVLSSIGLSMIKTYVGSQNISDADRNAVMATSSRLAKDPQARWELLQQMADMNDRRITDAQQFQAHIAKGGTLIDYPYNWLKTTDEKAQRNTPSLTEAAGANPQAPPQASQPSQNMTARWAAQQMLNRPDATPQDKLRARQLLGQ